MASKKSSGGPFATFICGLLAVSLIVAFFKVPAHQSVDGTLNFFSARAETIKVWAQGLGDDFSFGDLFNSDGTGPSGSSGSGSNEGGSDSGGDNGGDTTASAGTVKPNTSTDKAVDMLSNISVSAANNVDYDRDDWDHWNTAPGGAGSCWNTRDEVLYRQSDPGALVLLDKDKKTTTDKSKACSVGEGLWVGPYTGKTFTNPSDLDVDHVGALGYVARHGGQDWDADKKAAYANDLDGNHLLAVEAGANRSKSDKGPSEWKPEEAYQCDYAKYWIESASAWKYSITSDDQKALSNMLETC